MKLLRFGPAGQERPGILGSDGRIRDLSSEIADFTPEVMTVEMVERLRRVDTSNLPTVEGNPRIGSPVARTGHYIAIGLNYEDHAREAGMAIPNEPVIFSKAPSSLCGPYDDVIQPKGSQKLDWEAELGFVIGKRAWQVSEDDALSHVLGYCVGNDVSERGWQIESTGQWIKGKSAPTFGPLGPWLVTSDEVPDPQNLDVWLDVNGQRMQSGSTKTMIFPVRQLVSFLSHRFLLEPGDVVITGTPPGVGLGKKPNPIFLKVGDVMTLGVQGLGEQRQTVVAG